ncbi:hypothetical protein O0I10_004299 [Lichtheimia ornata]|uniref:Uncharacterized protein n=1 Tax=Lichtheimia ornata TaxID=688661 RepID=A0AAD7V748_9FUNG|nr:uncharacterized protein O0I10_004299 [Lichtheimia ornata]KAJ8660070.1 hypothetical protein O0I10_004299 [Lichtheimia ornata]
MQHRQDPSVWSLDKLLDDMSIESKHNIHVVTPSRLSHHSSIASSASSSSTHSRQSTFSIPEPTSPIRSQHIRIPVTQYQVPNAYDDDDDEPSNTSTIEPKQQHFSVASFGMTSNCARLFFDHPCEHLYDVEWSVQNSNNDTLLTLMQFPADRSCKTELMALGHRLGITTLLIYTNMSNFDSLYTQMDVLQNCMPEDNNDQWLQHLLFVFDQSNTPTSRMEQESKHVIERIIPYLRSRYKLHKDPGAVFVTSTPAVVRHPQYGATYQAQCKNVLWEAINKLHREFGRWRPNNDSSDDDDDDDDDDLRLLQMTKQS